MTFPADSALGALMATLPRPGQVRWIGLRPARDVPMDEVGCAEAVAGKGLVGDRYGSGSGKRGITLIQAEHLPVIAALSGLPAVAPATLRRNVLVAGIPLVALKMLLRSAIQLIMLLAFVFALLVLVLAINAALALAWVLGFENTTSRLSAAVVSWDLGPIGIMLVAK